MSVMDCAMLVFGCCKQIRKGTRLSAVELFMLSSPDFSVRDF